MKEMTFSTQQIIAIAEYAGLAIPSCNFRINPLIRFKC